MIVGIRCALHVGPSPPERPARYSRLFLEEAVSAAGAGRFERLFWLSDRRPSLMHWSLGPAWEAEAGGGALHAACRAADDRCVRLCLGKEVGSYCTGSSAAQARSWASQGACFTGENVFVIKNNNRTNKMKRDETR